MFLAADEETCSCARHRGDCEGNVARCNRHRHRHRCGFSGEAARCNRSSSDQGGWDSGAEEDL